MPLVLELDVADLAATRFAASPLCETIKAVQLLAAPGRATVNRPWVSWAQRQLDGNPLRVARLWPLAVTGLQVFPEFLTPAPESQWPSVDDELARMRATPAEHVRASLKRVFADAPWPASAVELMERPGEALAAIASELAECHDRLILPHWERIRSVLDADIAYRSGLLASGGARDLFRDMHPDMHWSAGKLTLSDSADAAVRRVMLGPDGVVLIPSVFTWPEASVKRATSTQTILVYPARGAGTLWLDQSPSAGTAIDALLGGTRARLLDALRSPASTTYLARQLDVSPSAISQHLTALHRGGLLTRQRSGRTVLYQISDLGLALLTAGAKRA